MAAFSNYAKTQVLNATLRNTAFTPPSALYIALYTTNPTATDTGSEVLGGSYLRQAISFDAPSGGAVSNTYQIVFPEATASWGAVGYFGIRDALSGGNLWYYGAWTVAKTVTTGDQLQLNVNELTVTLT